MLFMSKGKPLSFRVEPAAGSFGGSDLRGERSGERRCKSSAALAHIPPPSMASAVETGFARSQALQHEWDELKVELARLETSLARRASKSDAARESAIEGRLGEITAEMAQVLSVARGELPAPASYDVPEDGEGGDGDDSDSLEQDDFTSLRREPHVKHTEIRRTYDSTDSEAVESAEDLRMRMRMECLDPSAKREAVTVVESHGGGGAGMLMNKLKKAGEGVLAKAAANANANSNAKTQGNGPKRRELTDMECDDLRLEVSRLERQARKLKRKQDRTTDDNVEAKRIETRLEVIAASLENGFAAPGSMSDDDDDSDDDVVDSRGNQPAAVRLFSSLGRGLMQQVVPKDKDKDKDADADAESDEEVAGNSKRRSAGGMGAFRKLGRKKKDGKASPTEKGESSASKSFGSLAKAQDGANTSSNPFAEVSDKLAKRGEKLGALDKQADEMTDNATNMRSAAANLRKRQEQKNKFW